MRYFVLCESSEPDMGAYILAEVVREPGDAKELSLAASLAGARAHVLTRTELLLTAEGRNALERWDKRDDSIFNHETAVLSKSSRHTGSSLLWAIDDDARPMPRTTGKLPLDPRFREVMIRAQGLRAATRALVEQARAFLVEQREAAPAPNGHRGEGVGR